MTLDPGLIAGAAEAAPMTSEAATAIGVSAGFLAFVVWMLWPVRHRCPAGERCPHHNRDYDLPL